MSGYKNTFKMIEGDTVVDNDLILVGGQEELRQNLENRLAVNKNEWFLDIELGLDYSEITGKGISDERIGLAIRECCFQDERIKEVRDIRIERMPETRYAKIDILAIDGTNEEIDLEGVIDIG